MTRRVEVDVVIVTHNSQDTIQDCLESVKVQGVHATVTVVDSGSSDSTADIVRSQSIAHLAVLPNIGFAPAVNIALAQTEAEKVLLLNPDAVLAPGSLRRLLDVLDSRSELGVLAPRLLDADGAPHRYAAKRFPSGAHTFARLSGVERFLPKRLRETIDLPNDGVVSVPLLTGAVLVMRRSVLQNTGGLDTLLPMYFEDLELCERCRRLGLGVAVVCDATAIHRGRYSSERSTHRDLLKVLEDGHAPWLYLTTFVGRSAGTRFRVAVLLGGTVRTATSWIWGLANRQSRVRASQARRDAQLLVRWALTRHGRIIQQIRSVFTVQPSESPAS